MPWDVTRILSLSFRKKVVRAILEYEQIDITHSFQFVFVSVCVLCIIRIVRIMFVCVGLCSVGDRQLLWKRRRWRWRDEARVAGSRADELCIVLRRVTRCILTLRPRVCGEKYNITIGCEPQLRHARTILIESLLTNNNIQLSASWTRSITF